MNTARASLFCVPHAGGSAAFFRPLADCLPAGMVFPLELPGRGRRSREPLCRSLATLADDLFAQILSCTTGRPYALFGHSMGGLLAYLCALQLRDAGLRPPEALFVSGCGAPSVMAGDGRRPRYLLPRDEFFEMLRDLGGCPDEVLTEPLLLDYFEPILRADFEAVDTWRYRARGRLTVPVIAFNASADPAGNSAAEWARETSSEFCEHRFEGGHFFVTTQWPAIASTVAERLAVGVCVPG